MKKYVATRKDVCAGELLKTNNVSFKIIDSNNNEISEEKFAEHGIFNMSINGGLECGGFSIYSGLVCRGMLFNVNENGLANDLIYTTPTNYPIKDIQPKIDVESQFIIDNYVELEELLKYLNYSVDLTQNDLNRIYSKFITNNQWLYYHMKLFGWKKLGNGCYGSGGIETIPKKIYDNLSNISCYKNGRPNKEEPGYSLIKKIKK